MIKRVIGSGLLAAGIAVGMVAQTAAPAGALNAGVAAAVITGTVDTSAPSVQFQNVALAGVFAAADTAGKVSACPTQVAVTNLFINYSIESPAEGPLPAGLFYNAGSFAAGGGFGGTAPLGLCSVNGGVISNGALFSATAPLAAGALCPALSAIPNKPGNNPCQGISFLSVGTVALAELSVSYNVSIPAGGPATTNVFSGPQEAVAVVDAVPGACTTALGNLNCALVAGTAVVA